MKRLKEIILEMCAYHPSSVLFVLGAVVFSIGPAIESGSVAASFVIIGTSLCILAVCQASKWR